MNKTQISGHYPFQPLYNALLTNLFNLGLILGQISSIKIIYKQRY
jgi:hypothetical protein